MDDQGLFDDDPVLSRRERLRAQREAAHRAPTRVGLRFTAAATVVVGLLVWLAVSWLTSSPSASEQLPEDPALREEPGSGGGEDERGEAGETGESGDAESSTGPEASGSSAEEAATPSGDAPSTTPVVVHVAGAVEHPGVVELQSGDRVRDAVAAAGGLTDDAAAEGINLAAEAVDGGYLHVPTVEELESGELPAAPADPGGGGAAGDSGGADDGDGASAPVDLNRAEAETLQRLPGIGPALADRIIEHRNAAGPFESLEDLAGVSGIGPSTLEDVEDQVTW